MAKKMPFWKDKSFWITVLLIISVVGLIIAGKLDLSEELLAGMLVGGSGGAVGRGLLGKDLR